MFRIHGFGNELHMGDYRIWCLSLCQETVYSLATLGSPTVDRCIPKPQMPRLVVRDYSHYPEPFHLYTAGNFGEPVSIILSQAVSPSFSAVCSGHTKNHWWFETSWFSIRFATCPKGGYVGRVPRYRSLGSWWRSRHMRCWQLGPFILPWLLGKFDEFGVFFCFFF